MSENIWVLGGYQIDFARNLTREGLDFAGEIELGDTLPINPSVGLIGGGHPVGASGVRMLLDAAKQVSGTGGAYQIEGASTFGTLAFGGSTATTVSLVVGSAPAA